MEDFRDGVYLVPLAPLRDPALVVPTIAAALGVRESGETPLLEALKYALRDRERLLVIDNFEQVHRGGAPAVGELLAAAPGLKVLVTSRAPLHVYGEHEYAVPPMEVPHPRALPSLERLAQAEAVSLFVQRARRVRPGFALDEENAPAVAEICARLDGLPLAIELAAARVRLFSPQAMLAHLGSAARRPACSSSPAGRETLPARQRTLRATIEWSYNLLDADERASFAASPSLPAAAPWRPWRPSVGDDDDAPHPCGRRTSGAGPPRIPGRPKPAPGLPIRLLPALRCWRRCASMPGSGWRRAARRRRCATGTRRYYTDALQAWGADLKGLRQLEALAEIEADLDNARAAWAWAVERGPEQAMDRRQVNWLGRALEGLCDFYEWRGRYREGEAVCRKAVAFLKGLCRVNSSKPCLRLKVQLGQETRSSCGYGPGRWPGSVGLTGYWGNSSWRIAARNGR